MCNLLYVGVSKHEPWLDESHENITKTITESENHMEDCSCINMVLDEDIAKLSFLKLFLYNLDAEVQHQRSIVLFWCW